MNHFSFKKYRGSFLLILAMVALFELATDVTGYLEPVLFPGLSKVLPAFWDSLPKMTRGFFSSMMLFVPSYFAALSSGIIVGMLVGYFTPLRNLFMPIFRFLNPIPPTILIPYSIAILPTFWMSSAFIMFAGAFWPVVMNTINGVLLLEERYLDNARTLGLRGFKLFRKVIFPGALPLILNGAGSALVFSFILLSVAEIFGAKYGMGHFIQYYADFSDYARVLAGMIFMATIIVLVMELFDFIQKRALFWTGKR